ncbi:hypothetical protein EDD29_7095 [Actinocorallia herbida]|uniref:Uncharacterized protein n=1 Tax=Actinocorallia herbida TaxID=58109 RepID=A0A3N1D7A2_9ACTN|nr:hypothetical protein [Actinocorallia herbida]ROO89405.1 hypothetical protein EDD29_7095 [Actinocorallia herbida]
MRDGYFTMWHGEEYACAPGEGEVRLYSADPRIGFTAAAPGRFVKVVPAWEVDQLKYVVTRCVWRDEPFLIIGEHDGWLRVEYTGGSALTAEALGLEYFDRGVYQAWAPVTEVGQVREEVYG